MVLISQGMTLIKRSGKLVSDIYFSSLSPFLAWFYLLISCPIDDPDLFHDFPIALQIVGKRYKDEEVLKVTKVVDNALKSGQ